MPTYVLLLWLIIGALVGWSAPKFLGTPGPYGLGGDLGAGAIGAVLGGYVLGLLGASGTIGLILSLLTAAIGAAILLWLLRRLVRR